MNFHRESRREHYDVVIVGAGIGGLTAGALLARTGLSVLVIERHDRPGGYLHAFTRRGFIFDSAVHSVGGCASSGPFHRRALGKLVEALGLTEKVRFLPLDPIARLYFPDFSLDLCQGEDRLLRQLKDRFPLSGKSLEAFLRLTERVAEEASRAACGLPGEWTLLHRYRRATLADVYAGFLDDDRLLAVLGGLWPYLGLPPGRLSFIYWALMFMGYVNHGAGYCEGSFQRLADGLAQVITEAEGEMMYRVDVRSIELERGRVAGVVTANGQRIRSCLVIANGDLFHTVRHLLPSDHSLGRYFSRLAAMKPSLSVFVVYAAVQGAAPKPGGHEAFFYPHYDHDEFYQAACRNQAQWFSVTIPTRTDPGLAPDKTHCLMLTTLASYEAEAGWRNLKRPFQERLMKRADERFPGIWDGLVFSEAGTPRTMERYTLNHRGAAYGWAPQPGQVGPERPAVAMLVEGLYLAGHWSSPGGGVYGAALSGIQAAQEVLGLERQAQLWRWVAQSSRATDASSC